MKNVSNFSKTDNIAVFFYHEPVGLMADSLGFE